MQTNNTLTGGFADLFRRYGYSLVFHPQPTLADL